MMYFFEKNSPYVSIQWYINNEWIISIRPSKLSRQKLILQYIAEKIPSDFRWSEQDMNNLLQQLHGFDDVALLRRELYITHYIDRTTDGKEYWKEVR